MLRIGDEVVVIRGRPKVTLDRLDHISVDEKTFSLREL